MDHCIEGLTYRSPKFIGPPQSSSLLIVLDGPWFDFVQMSHVGCMLHTLPCTSAQMHFTTHFRSLPTCAVLLGELDLNKCFVSMLLALKFDWLI